VPSNLKDMVEEPPVIEFVSRKADYP